MVPRGWKPPTTLRATAPLLRRLLRIRTSSPTSEQPRRPWRPSSSFVPRGWKPSASGPARLPPNRLGDHGGRPHLHDRPVPRRRRLFTAPVDFAPEPHTICRSYARGGHGGRPSRGAPSLRSRAPLCCSCAPRGPAASPAHRPSHALRAPPSPQAFGCDWFPGVGSRRRPFGPRHPSFAVYSASGPARRPPNSLGDHGGRPLHLCPRPAPLACAPQRLHRHRPACLRFRPCKPSAAIGSQGLEAADYPSGHGTPPSPFTPHPDQLAYLRTASETMAAVLLICSQGLEALRIRTSSPTSEPPRRPWRPPASS